MFFLFYFILAVLIVFLSIICIFAFLFEIYSALTLSVPFVPVPKKVVRKIVAQFRMMPGDVLFDLGCGEGRVLREAVAEYPGIQAVGVEMGLLPYFLARVYAIGKPNLRILRENMYQSDISQATHIYLYLFPEVLEEILYKIHRECRPGTLVFSCDFSSKTYNPERVVELSDTGRGRKLFVYRV